MPNNPVLDVRQALGLSVMQLAVRLGCSVQAVYKWQRDGTTPTRWNQKRRFDSLQREAERLTNE